MGNQGSEVFVSLPSGWKPEAKIEETSPLSTDLTVIPCYHSAKSKCGAFAGFCLSPQRLLGNLLSGARWQQGSGLHFCFQGHNTN